MSRWLFTIKANESMSLDINGTLQLSQASLTSDAKPGKTMLKIRKDDNEYTLCSLESGNINSQLLNISLTDEDRCSLVLSGVNSINLLGQFHSQFRGGFELHHFGLVPLSPYDPVNLRKEEKVEEDTRLNDDIALGLINAMRNTNDELHALEATVLLERLNEQRANRRRAIMSLNSEGTRARIPKPKKRKHCT